MLKFFHASRASQGARPYQEDAAAVWPGQGELVPDADPDRLPEGVALVAVLADGMGGHAGGALASATICSAFLAHFVAADGDGRGRLMPSLQAANRAIGEKVRDDPALAGMGATLVGVSIGPQGLSWVSVGDSPMYLFRAGDLEQLNDDHSLAPLIDRMVAQGKMTPEQARADPRRHYLRSAVTGEEMELIDAPERMLELAPGDLVIVSSDGIHSLDEEAIRAVVAEQAGNGPKAIADALVEAVDAMGEPHQDNTTVVVISVEDL
ncbi:MAG: PP2C family serine/threonine-protein phosphatase [Hyphomicrobiaceae bacterium]